MENLLTFQEWYEMWWMNDLPGRTWPDLWYERLYDWRLRNRPVEMIRTNPGSFYEKDVV